MTLLYKDRPAPVGQVAGQRQAEIVHLASRAQVWAINHICDFIGWDQERRAAFLREKFDRESPAILTTQQARAYTTILLTIAADKDLRKDPKVTTVSRAMIKAHLPTLLQKLGLGQRHQ